MRIITVNIPVPILNIIANLVGEDRLYPSRSELIRVAIREHMLREVPLAKELKYLRDHGTRTKPIELDPTQYVQVPQPEGPPRIYNLVHKP